MTASDFPISFPYGAVSAPYSAAHPHRGDDRPCPEGTPVVINGVTIGLTGHTGLAIGPHLHIQEWQGNVANTRKPQNAFKPGQVVAATQSSDFGNYVSIVTADGWTDSYCHLSQINVKVGQQIGDEVSTVGEVEFHDLYEAFFGPMTNNPPTDGDRKRWIGAETNTVLRAMQADPRHPAWLSYIEDLKKSPGSGVKPTPLTKGIYEVN